MNGAVLVADDDALVGEFISRVLTAAHFDVSVTESGEEAVRLARATVFSLAILDQNMPGLTGAETAAAIRRLPRCLAMPILLCTADSRRSTFDDAVASGVTGFMVKPFNAQSLLKRVYDVHRVSTVHWI